MLPSHLSALKDVQAGRPIKPGLRDELLRAGYVTRASLADGRVEVTITGKLAIQRSERGR